MSHEMSLEDAYKTLGISPDASDHEVTRAFKKLALQKHPGKINDISYRVLEMSID